MRISEERERVRDRLSAISRGEMTGDAPRLRGDDGEPTVPDWLRDSDEAAADTRFPMLPERWRGTRFGLHKWGAAALVIVAFTAAFVGMFAVWWDSPTMHAVPPLPSISELPAAVRVPVTPAAQTVSSVLDTPAPTGMVVSVVGLVQNPGLVTLAEGSRVADALSAAGGMSIGGDTMSLNLAQKLSDGDQVVVGAVGDSADTQTSSTTSGGGSGQSGDSGALVNLNTATEAELDALPGVGPVTASAIIAWRASNGKFTDVEQLGEVDGIGPARLDKLRTLVSV